MNRLVVYAVSFFNGEELMGGVWEDLDKAKSTLESYLEEISVDAEFQDLAESIESGEWEGEPVCIQGVHSKAMGTIGVISALQDQSEVGLSHE